MACNSDHAQARVGGEAGGEGSTEDCRWRHGSDRRREAQLLRRQVSYGWSTLSRPPCPAGMRLMDPARRFPKHAPPLSANQVPIICWPAVPGTISLWLIGSDPLKRSRCEAQEQRCATANEARRKREDVESSRAVSRRAGSRDSGRGIHGAVCCTRQRAGVGATGLTAECPRESVDGPAMGIGIASPLQPSALHTTAVIPTPTRRRASPPAWSAS